ncbi:MAG TPA: DUF3667 domain-containing protein [Gemmatimonadaceae bacterium]
MVTDARAQACLNCGASLTGPFCPECGQRDIPPYPSLRELFMDAVSEFSGWDGRVASTLQALARRPGLLTHEFLEGRRARYISPLRLYLTASLVYFVLAASAPDVRLGPGKGQGLQVGVPTTADNRGVSRPDRVAKAARESLDQQTLTQAEKDAALKDIERAPALLQPFLRRVVSDPGGFKRGLLETMPRMLFALLPIFAGIVALFYRGRKYPEHLYFAIHLHAFIFLALGATELTKFTKVPVLVAIVSAIAVCWIPVYATLAFRRVYGGSLAVTLAKEVVIGALYSIATAAAFVIAIYLVAIGP